jgi:hypothetical protein
MMYQFMFVIQDSYLRSAILTNVWRQCLAFGIYCLS